MHPISYAKGITEIGNIIKKTKITPRLHKCRRWLSQLYILILIPQSLDNYFDEIKKSLENLKLRIIYQRLYVSQEERS